MKIDSLTKKLKLKCKINNNFTLKGFCSLDKIRNFNILFYEGNNLNYINKKGIVYKYQVWEKKVKPN